MPSPMPPFPVALAPEPASNPAALGHNLVAHNGLLIMVWYVLAFGMAPAYAYVYWLRTPGMSFLRALGYAHLFTIYSYQWLFAGWWAVFNVARRRRGWAKTTRTVDAAPVHVTQAPS